MTFVDGFQENLYILNISNSYEFVRKYLTNIKLKNKVDINNDFISLFFYLCQNKFILIEKIHNFLIKSNTIHFRQFELSFLNLHKVFSSQCHHLH